VAFIGYMYNLIPRSNSQCQRAIWLVYRTVEANRDAFEAMHILPRLTYLSGGECLFTEREKGGVLHL